MICRLKDSGPLLTFLDRLINPIIDPPVFVEILQGLRGISWSAHPGAVLCACVRCGHAPMHYACVLLLCAIITLAPLLPISSRLSAARVELLQRYGAFFKILSAALAVQIDADFPYDVNF